MNRYRHYFALEKRLQNSGYLMDRSEVVLEMTSGRTRSRPELVYQSYLKEVNKS